MLNAAIKADLIEKIASLPDESTPDERIDAARLVEIEELMVEINNMLLAFRQTDEERAQRRQETIEAIEAAERGELVTVGDIDGLFASLHADD